MAILLDKEQARVVEYNKSTICIAGPGSGKTRVLAAKAEALWSQSQDTICLTYTRSAAEEIRSRIPGLPAYTIHSFCHSVMGWRSGESYEDLLVNFLKEGKDSFAWVLVDEFQDLTPTQLSVIFSIVGKNIFAVGDPYQSIYQYGGAMGKQAFEEVHKQFNCEEFHLKNNYRSVPEVVRDLNRIYKRGLVSKGVNENGLTSILTRTNDQVREVSGVLRDADLGHMVRSGSSELSKKQEEDFGNQNLQISTIHMAKGLEFDHVILWDWRPRRNEEDQNLYYVANSRASLDYFVAYEEQDLISLIKGSIPSWEENPYKGKKRGEISTVHGIFITPEWFYDMKPYLEKAGEEAPTKESKILAKTSLGMLLLGRRLFDQGQNYQASLTNKQSRFLAGLAEQIGLEDAQERLMVGLW